MQSSSGFSPGFCPATALSVLPSGTGCRVEKSLLCGDPELWGLRKALESFPWVPSRAEALCPVRPGWLTGEGGPFAALQFCNSVFLSCRITGQATHPERWDKMSPDMGERPWGQPEIGLQFSFYLFQGAIKRNILHFLTPNSQWGKKNHKETLSKNQFWNSDSTKFQTYNFVFLAKPWSESITVIGTLYLCPRSLHAWGWGW